MEEVIEIGAAEEDNNVKLLKKCELCKREYRLYPSYSFIDPKPRLLPKMLPTCLHTFCHDCIEQRRRGLGIICPKCNKRRHFVHTMQLENNYDLLGMLHEPLRDSLPNLTALCKESCTCE